MLINIVVAFLFGWIVFLSFTVYKMQDHYQQLISRTKKRTIDDILDKILRNVYSIENEKEEIKKEIIGLTNNFQRSIHKIGLVHFYPFGKTNGEKSFVTAFLDANNNGLLINFIYTHEGVKIYARTVIEGKGKDYELSKEEKEAIVQAGQSR